MLSLIISAWLLSCLIFDLKFRRLPNWLTLGILPLAIVLLIVSRHGLTGAGWLSCLSAWFVALILTLPAYVLRWLGAGDVKMLTALGLMTGLNFMLLSYAIAAVISLAVFLGWMLLQKIVPYLNLQLSSSGRQLPAMPVLKGKQLPFGAMIAIGGLLLLIGQWFATDFLAIT